MSTHGLSGRPDRGPSAALSAQLRCLSVAGTGLPGDRLKSVRIAWSYTQKDRHKACLFAYAPGRSLQRFVPCVLNVNARSQRQAWQGTFRCSVCAASLLASRRDRSPRRSFEKCSNHLILYAKRRGCCTKLRKLTWGNGPAFAILALNC
jgi:hypothetical protein